MKKYFNCFLFFLSLSTSGQIVLPKLIGDGMVLQRDTEIRVWGWSSSEEKINLTFKDKNYRTQADANGNWQILLPSQKAGGPYTILLKGKNEIKLDNILFGDVWFCSGQSNMVHQMRHHDVTYARDIVEANNAQIRQFLVPTLTNLTEPALDYGTEIQWKEANPENVKTFSAVAYFFALKIYESQKIPIGIINASVGGTPIEAWTSEAGFKDFEDILSRIERNKDTAYVNSFNRPRSFGSGEITDKGILQKWHEPSYNPINWKPINIPGYWEDQGIEGLNGVVWYRKEIDIPASMQGKEAMVFLGRIIDADELYINGQKVGNTGYQYPQRRYAVPAGLLKSGKNLFVVKVTNNNGKGGFVPDKPYCIFAGTDTVDLKGTWTYRVGDIFVPGGRFGGFGFSAQNQPASLFNAMAAPVTQVAIKGVLWYQGESNAGRPEAYEGLQKAQIRDWRRQWKKDDLPFLYVQLPNFMDANYLPSESNWARLRESQRLALSEPHTAMAVGIDLGEWNDIHPDNKKDVGERLALAAKQMVYHENVVGSGPMFKSLRREEGKLILSFSHTGGGLISDDGEDLREFAIAGLNKKYVWANAKIVGDEIEIWNEGVERPLYVRYAWANNPDVNFYIKEGLPASPFQAELKSETDQLWHGKKAAVVLTYDDALNVHLDHAIPALDDHDLKGSFYLTGFAQASKDRITEWRAAAKNGHELGNHTIYHPCDATRPGRNWVTPENDLSKYSTAKILNEIRMTNVYLEAIDGQKERTFAYTCGDMETGEGSFVEAIKDDFVASRGVRGQLNEIGKINLQNIDCYVVNGESGKELIQWVKNAQEKNALLTILFHGVGGEHSLNVSLEAHAELLDYLEKNKNDVWTTTMIEAAQHVKKHQ